MADKSKNTPIKKPVPKWFFLVPVLIPVIFFLLLEFSLRAFGYGFEYKQWVEAVPGKYMLNPETAKRYFYTTSSIPTANPNFFDKEKGGNSFRVFILGGSSAAGYPYSPNGDFGRYLDSRLRLTYPFSKIEVVNLAMTAVNSYTIRDLIPSVLEQKPDLIILYAGHNEYYGALGAGSMESFGSSPFLVNLSLSLNKYRTFQLLREIVKWGAALFASPSKEAGGTLMARMAKDQLITLGGDVYEAGLEQFRSNLDDILKMASEHDVPVLLGTVASNLKDQPPFIPAETPGYPEADKVYAEALEQYAGGNTKAADSLFRLAKDLDALKFRAPERINSIIKETAAKYKYPVSDIDAYLGSISPGGITGNNLMIDHLHPDLNGYMHIGKKYFEDMINHGFTPSSPKNSFTPEIEDSAARASVYFSGLDSIISRYRVIVLKNDWPFSEYTPTQQLLKQFGIRDEIDSLALYVIADKLSWEAAHLRAAALYFNRQDYDNYVYEIELITAQYPYRLNHMDKAAEFLIQAKEYDRAYSLLLKRYKLEPDQFTTKWLGIIDLSKNRLDNALKYLTESIKFSESDPQVLYNLAGAYSLLKDYKSAHFYITKVLMLDASYPGAANLKSQLDPLVQK